MLRAAGRGKRWEGGCSKPAAAAGRRRCGRDRPQRTAHVGAMHLPWPHPRPAYAGALNGPQPLPAIPPPSTSPLTLSVSSAGNEGAGAREAHGIGGCTDSPLRRRRHGCRRPGTGRQGLCDARSDPALTGQGEDAIGVFLRSLAIGGGGLGGRGAAGVVRARARTVLFRWLPACAQLGPVSGPMPAMEGLQACSAGLLASAQG